MIDELLPFPSAGYFSLLGAMLFSRGADFLSTWIATPNLVLEANPLAKRLGWRWGILLNILICVLFAVWPLPAIIIITNSLLVAARNFQSAWLMRSLGEHAYRHWVCERLGQTPWGLYLFCLAAQTILLASVGGVLMIFSRWQLVPFAVGMGIITYAVAVTIYTFLAAYRLRRSLP